MKFQRILSISGLTYTANVTDTPQTGAFTRTGFLLLGKKGAAKRFCWHNLSSRTAAASGQTSKTTLKRRSTRLIQS
jgi:hypothetical protein